MIKILVPTDYSPEAKNATLYAYHFAQYTGGSIVLYHAMPSVIPLTDIPYENYYLDEKQEQELLLNSFHNLLLSEKLAIEKIQVEAHVDQQNVIAFGIEHACKHMNCDIVIMGTHGASGLKKLFLGSNTSQFIATASMPIIAVPAQYRFEPIYHLIYASDLRNLEEELGILIPFTEVFHAALEVIYFDYAGPESETLILEARSKIESYTYKNIKLSIKRGSIHLSVAENLKTQVDTSNTQLLVMVSGEHSWFENLMLASNTQKMVLTPDLPILVMRKGEA